MEGGRRERERARGTVVKCIVLMFRECGVLGAGGFALLGLFPSSRLRDGSRFGGGEGRGLIRPCLLRRLFFFCNRGNYAKFLPGDVFDPYQSLMC